ncbi:MAG: hypothetical protein WCL70_11710 [Paludibacter sp.]
MKRPIFTAVLMTIFTAFSITIAQITPISVKSLPNGAYLLEPINAYWIKQNENVSPKLEAFPDGDGFEAQQLLSPLALTEGALGWNITVPKADRYFMTLEYAATNTGNAFEVKIGNQRLNSFAPDTRGSLALLELGEVNLSIGSQVIVLNNLSATGKTFLSVASIYLRPATKVGMTRPEIRAAITSQKTEKLPAELLMPSIFSDHMVLQRLRKVPIWGRSAPGTKVNVQLNGQKKQAVANETGRWKLLLDPMEAGGPYKMEVSANGKTIRYTDVLVGEVWFGSGQSNMEVSVKFLPKFATPEAPYECDEETRKFLEAGCDSLIRISAVTRDHSKTPQWTSLTKDNYLDVPAMMSSVAVLLRNKLNIPIGIIVRCESSSSSGIWLSRDAVESDAEIQRQLRNYTDNEYPKLVAAYPEKLKAWEEASAKAKLDGTKAAVKPNVPDLAGGFSLPYLYNSGRSEHYGANYPIRIANVIPYAVTGIVWDQGENGTGIAGVDQSAVMPALVRSWREVWGDEKLPFIYVRKNKHPESLPNVLTALGNTYQVSNVGLGQINHPPDKTAYARRVVEQIDKIKSNK